MQESLHHESTCSDEQVPSHNTTMHVAPGKGGAYSFGNSRHGGPRLNYDDED